jgi:hypothetical protein
MLPLACAGPGLGNQRTVRTMTYRIHPAFIASLGAIVVMLAANDASARSGTASRGGFASAHAMAHSSARQSLRHHRFNNVGTFWPGVGDDGFYGPSNGEITAGVGQPASGDVHYTYDVPWDWAHRYPPIIAPSDRPYVPSCPTQTVAVPGRDGTQHAVNITQCF